MKSLAKNHISIRRIGKDMFVAFGPLEKSLSCVALKRFVYLSVPLTEYAINLNCLCFRACAIMRRIVPNLN